MKVTAAREDFSSLVFDRVALSRRLGQRNAALSDSGMARAACPIWSVAEKAARAPPIVLDGFRGLTARKNTSS